MRNMTGATWSPSEQLWYAPNGATISPHEVHSMTQNGVDVWLAANGRAAREVDRDLERMARRIETAGTEHSATKEQAAMKPNPQKESTNPKDRFGREKPDITSIPPAALIHEALAMQNGASKYGPYNWRAKTVAARVYLAAACRHIMSYLDGEQNASDSGIHHLGHARASLGIVLDAESMGTLVDDRPIAGQAAALLAAFTKKHPGKDVEPEPERPEGDCLAEDPSSARHHRLRRAETSGNAQSEAVCGKQEWSKQDNHLAGFGNYWTGGENVGHIQPKYHPRGYIGGPMRGYPKFNFPAFDRARDLAIQMGLDPISPADLDRNSGFHEDAPAADAFGPEITREFVTRDSQALLSLRAELGDWIALLPGWERSTGAVAEFFIARWLGLRILDATTMEPFNERQINNLDLSVLQANIRRTMGGK